ncbi:DUF2971 domain-containing protein [Shewanella woodyi]|uniref:DUF2971 domain-containing protein n=1 Tax=Shewanella woodyi TaxID=60961 RepID=UPI0007F972FB|nr:DUF2971 domain-containing protein [Shewanella woodyi]
MNWIEQFTDMIFPLNREQLNIEGAFLLKNQHLPKSIFKYREVNKNSIKNLEEDTVWLADPSNFNDPYDCAHTVDFSRMQKYQSSTFFDKFMKEKGSDINLSVEQKNTLSMSQDPIGDLIDILLSGEPPERREGIKAALTSAQNKMHEDLALANSKSIASTFKLCSFSERNDSMLMWAHYASYHQGFCIEYDLESIPYADYRRRFLYPAIYSDDMFDATEHLMKGVEDENFNNLHLSLAGLVKAKDWEYEKEWRLVFANEIFESERSYNIGKPKKVYLGTKISQDNQDRLIEICSRRDIPVSKMKAHHSMFKLESASLKDAEQHFFKEKA